MYTLDKTMRTWVEIDLSALKHNLNYAKRSTGRKVICVIKADAYGHGAVECGKFLEANGADMFAVAALQEAIELRENGIKLPILVLGYTAPEHAAIIAKLDLEQTVVDEEHAYALNQAAKEAGVTVKVHASLDTGMSRIGIFAQTDHMAAIRAVENICNMNNLSVVGMYTHFAAADDPSEYEFTSFQYRNYSIVYSGLAERGIRIPNCHVSNSAAILSHQMHFDSIREGIMLYGLYPNSKPVEYGVLEPVMTLKTRVTQVRPLPSGVTVGYGRTYRTAAPITSAVIGAGYADGFERAYAGCCVRIGDRMYRQIGRICMDQFMVDVTPDEGEECPVRVGDPVTLFGGDDGLMTDTLARLAHTINYEVVCKVSKRVPRVVL